MKLFKLITFWKWKQIQLRWELFQFLTRFLDLYQKKFAQFALKEG